jgi:hypothetical protein
MLLYIHKNKEMESQVSMKKAKSSPQEISLKWQEIESLSIQELRKRAKANEIKTGGRTRKDITEELALAELKAEKEEREAQQGSEADQAIVERRLELLAEINQLKLSDFKTRAIANGVK